MKFLCEIFCFSPIAVDPQVGTTEGKTFDIIFVGTTRGRVIKVINAQAADSKYELKNVWIILLISFLDTNTFISFFRERSEVDTIVIEELQVFDPDVIIRDVKVMGGGLVSRLIYKIGNNII